ncbi:MAG: hypothetical protein AAB758_03075 [Patescibacteria group bacterium]
MEDCFRYGRGRLSMVAQAEMEAFFDEAEQPALHPETRELAERVIVECSTKNTVYAGFLHMMESPSAEFNILAGRFHAIMSRVASGKTSSLSSEEVDEAIRLSIFCETLDSFQ